MVLVQSCSYDTTGWGAIFKGSQSGLPAAAQWPTYFTADLACSNGASCTCSSSSQACPPHHTGMFACSSDQEGTRSTAHLEVWRSYSDQVHAHDEAADMVCCDGDLSK